MTSSPGPTPSARSAMRQRVGPVGHADRVRAHRGRRRTRSSKASTSGPRMKRPRSTTRAIAARSSARSGASGVAVSNSGTAIAAGPARTASRYPRRPRGPSCVLASHHRPARRVRRRRRRRPRPPGIFVLMLLESTCIPVPSEATMLFAGFNVSEGEYALLAVDAVGLVANLVGSWIAYAVGYYGRVEMLEKHGNKLHIKPLAPRLGGPLVRALRRRDRLLHPHAADHPHLHLAARGRRADAVLALLRADARSAASRGSSC